MANPKAEVEITASSRSLGAKLREARAKFNNFGLELKKQVFGKDLIEKGFWGKAGAQLVGNLGSRAAGDLASLFVEGAKEAYAYDQALTRLQIGSGATREEAIAMSNAIMKASAETGTARDKLLDGASGFVEFTGDMRTAVETMPLLARAMAATGASGKDLAGIFATFDKNLHLDPSQYGRMLDILVAQAHAGGVELRDLAGSFTRVQALVATNFLGGSTIEGQAQLSAMAQTVQNMTHDASLTSTYLGDALNDFAKDAPAIAKKLHINPYAIDPATGRKMLDEPLKLLTEIEKKTGGDVQKVHALFHDIRGGGALEYLMNNLDTVHSILEQSLNSNQVAKDFATQQASASARMEKAWNAVKLTIAQAFTPRRIQEFAHVLEDALSVAVKLGGVIDKAVFGIEQIFDANNLSKSDDETASITTQDLLTKNAPAVADKKAQEIISNPRGALAKMQAESLRAHPEGHDYDAVVRGAKNYLKSRGLLHEHHIDGAKPGEVRSLVRSDMMRPTYSPAAHEIKNAIKEAHGPMIDAIKSLTQELWKQRARPQPQPPVTVKVDGNAIARAYHSASFHNGRPGP